MAKLEIVNEHIKKDDAINIIRTLINIPSMTGKEKAIAEYLGRELLKSGLSIEYVEGQEGRPNVIACIEGQCDKKGLILVGHIDTVPVAQTLENSWETDPFEGEIRNDRIYGLGSSDMKGGIASILLAVKAILNVTKKLNKKLTIIFCVDEERGSREGMKYLCKSRRFRGDLAIAAEPTNMNVQGWFKGRTWYEIETRGKAVHSSNPAKGVNAIHNMVDIIYKIKKDGFQFGNHNFLGNCSLNFGSIEGGMDINTIPDLCKTKLEVRTVFGQTGEGVKKEIMAHIDELKKEDSTFDAKVRFWDGWESKDPMEIGLSNPMIERIQKASQSAIGKKLKLGRFGMGGGDLYFLSKSSGIPGIFFGPGNVESIHSANEYVNIEDITNAAKCYAAFILEFCEDFYGKK